MTIHILTGDFKKYRKILFETQEFIEQIGSHCRVEFKHQSVFGDQFVATIDDASPQALPTARKILSFIRQNYIPKGSKKRRFRIRLKRILELA